MCDCKTLVANLHPERACGIPYFIYKFVYSLQPATSFLVNLHMYRHMQMHFLFAHFTKSWFNVLLDPMSIAKCYALLNVLHPFLFRTKIRTYLKRTLIFADPGSSGLDQPLKRSVILQSVVGANPPVIHNSQGNP